MGNYCSQCGQLLSDTSRFCSKCGTPRAPSATGPAANPYSNTGFGAPEPIIAAFPAGLKTHGPINTGYIFAVTPSRFIFAAFRPDLQRQAIEQAKNNAAEQGKGFFGRMSASLGANRHFHERYRSMLPDQILAETQGNFQLPSNQISQIVYTKSRTYSVGDGDTDTDPAQIKLVSFSGEYRLEITQVEPEKEIIPALTAYYGHILRRR